MERTIIIKKPIWHKRAVGLNLAGMPNNTILNVEVHYKKKDGSYWDPFSYRATVGHVKEHAYDIQANKRYPSLVLHLIELANLQQHKRFDHAKKTV